MGGRLRSVVGGRPQVVGPVAGRAVLMYLLDQIADARIERVVLSTGHLAEQFAEVIGNCYRNIQIAYAHENLPLGTGGAIRFACEFTDADQLLVMNGDSYCDADLSSYIDWHVTGQNSVSLILVKVNDSSRYGTVEMDGGGRITAFIEKRAESTPGYINAGVYLFKRTMLEQFPAGPSSMERDVFPVWLRDGAMMGWPTEAEFIDIGIPSDYERSHEFMARVSP